MIEMEGAIPGRVALAADIMKALEQRSKLIEILQATNVLFLDLALGLGIRFQLHATIMREIARWRNSVQIYLRAQIVCRTGLGHSTLSRRKVERPQSCSALFLLRRSVERILSRFRVMSDGSRLLR